jgi:hypothetical protein
MVTAYIVPWQTGQAAAGYLAGFGAGLRSSSIETERIR